MHPSIKPLTPLTSSALDTLASQAQIPPKVQRSLSVSSSASSSTSSTYSRQADDLLDRLASTQAATTFHLWSAGNLRLHGRDLTLPSRDAHDLIATLRGDLRFEVVGIQHFDEHGEDWKVSIRRTSTTTSTPPLSDAE